MSKAIENLQAAQKHAMAIRPQVGGFPVLAETLRQAGVRRNIWYLPAVTNINITNEGPVVVQGVPLVTGFVDIPTFNQNAVIHALRVNQAGQSTFPEFLEAIWHAGIVRYEVDFEARSVTYYGCLDESYVETYPALNF